MIMERLRLSITWLLFFNIWVPGAVIISLLALDNGFVTATLVPFLLLLVPGAGVYFVALAIYLYKGSPLELVGSGILMLLPLGMLTFACMAFLSGSEGGAVLLLIASCLAWVVFFAFLFTGKNPLLVVTNYNSLLKNLTKQGLGWFISIALPVGAVLLFPDLLQGGSSMMVLLASLLVLASFSVFYFGTSVLILKSLFPEERK